MTKPPYTKKAYDGRLQLASILRQTARVVAYITLALGIGAVVASCQSNALDCTPKPLPKECRDAL